MHTTSGASRVMAGLSEMDAIVIKVNESNTLESMPRLGNMCYFITQRVGMLIGFLETNALNFLIGNGYKCAYGRQYRKKH